MPLFTIRVDHYVHRPEGELGPLLAAISDLKGSLMTSQAELAQQMLDLAAQADKAKAEVTQKIADLEAAIANAGQVDPAVEAALAALKASVQGVDDIVPDAPAP